MADELDLILIPGGGVRGNQPPEWVKRRLVRAAEIARQQPKVGIVTLSKGTPHKAIPHGEDGRSLYDSVVARDYLTKELGIDPRRVMAESNSRDTIGDGYFSRKMFAEPLGARRLHIITSDFHLPRVREIFSWAYNMGAKRDQYQLTFEGVSDIGLDQEMIAARIEKEQSRIEHLQGTKSRVSTMDQLTKWLYTEHAAYAPHLKVEPVVQNAALLGSY